MKILLATRGSNGDIMPYLNLASELEKRGHEVLVNLPKVFEKDIRPYQLEYVLQEFEDINGMINQADNEDKSFGVKTLLDWVKDSINKQVEQMIPLVEACDLYITTNTEFAASTIAEYCQKPFIRTAYAPFLPGKKIPPPLLPYTREDNFLVPLVWKLLNGPTDLMMKGVINKNRKELGLAPLKSLTTHSVSQAFNILMYSPSLGGVDPTWKWNWDITGYCFNDSFKYDTEAYGQLMDFIKQDRRPTLFFTFGSCSSDNGERFLHYLSDIVRRNGYKMIVGSGWSNIAQHVKEGMDHIFAMKNAIPHNLIFHECDAVIHHGGSGTTHNVARHGKPQMLVPLLLDQYYWGKRVQKLGIGPAPAKISKISKHELERRVVDLMTNLSYKAKAAEMGKMIAREKAIDKFCDLLYSVKGIPKKAV